MCRISLLRGLEGARERGGSLLDPADDRTEITKPREARGIRNVRPNRDKLAGPDARIN